MENTWPKTTRLCRGWARSGRSATPTGPGHVGAGCDVRLNALGWRWSSGGVL
jgi:hypothetical protein